MTATAARREQQSGREGAALLERGTLAFAGRRSSLRLRLIPRRRRRGEREREEKKQKKGEKNSPFVSSLFSFDAIPQQMVEVEAFSSVHDMIQAALDKHGGTATLREVRLAE